MKILGEKKNGIYWSYILVILMALLMLFFGIKQEKVINGFIFMIMGIVFFIIGIYFIVDITRYPQNIIVYNEIENTIILNNKVVISISTIKDVTFRNARSKSIVWKWGNVIIKTNGETYKCKYVKDCENVAKTLMKIMYNNEL